MRNVSRAVVLSGTGRFDMSPPMRVADPAAAAAPVIQAMFQKLMELDQKVSALAVSRPVEQAPADLAPYTPPQVDRTKFHDMFD